jgi:hypothetical protein
MTLDANSILASLLVSGIGFVIFSYGRSQHRAPQMIAGVVLMAFPYFVTGVLAMFGVAAVVCALLWAGLRLGWY